MSEAWAIAVFLSVVMICSTVIIVSNQWTMLTKVVIENNRTMMCQPVVCSCEGSGSNLYWDIYKNNTVYTNLSGDGK